MVNQTLDQYKQVLESCKEVFAKKTKDYGTAWRILRIPSITDQIYIKAQRIRSIQEKELQKVDEGMVPEFIGIINYCLMAIIQMDLDPQTPLELDYEELEPLYDQTSSEVMELLNRKNHDYDEAWRDMRVSSITDIILMKLLRVKQIEDNQGMTLVSEGVKANYQDIINYAVFALIKLNHHQ
ncbi:MAG: DUF1599 domain-containing protein [Cyclobacteriaceae bacterium]|nr:DUF1599 domain-containing protein [Cyclobacteriaceae bacterium]